MATNLIVIEEVRFYISRGFYLYNREGRNLYIKECFNVAIWDNYTIWLVYSTNSLPTLFKIEL
jgi:hypothetical protein